MIAVAAGADPATPLLDEDGNPHPSVVWYSPGGVVVGGPAKASMRSMARFQGNRFIRSIKAELGEDRRVDVGGEVRPAWTVASEIFRHLRRHAAESHGWEVGEAVVTVPVHFRGGQRSDIRRAAEQAGIKVLRFVHEPFAAVVGYYRSREMNLAALPDETILVFDWGGGTLDVTLVRSRDGLLEELAVGGLPKVAGDRFDEYVQDYARDAFLRRHGMPPESFQPSSAALDRFALEAERAKIALSTGTSSTIGVASVLERDGAVYDIREEITRPAFNHMITRDVDAAMFEVKQMLEQTRIASGEIDKALLVGGTSAVPLLRERMSELFGVRAQPVPNSQTVIAEGAATIAREGYEPFLASSIQVQLSDDSAYTVFGYQMRVPHEEPKPVTMFCTDNRDGEARLLVRVGTGDADRRTTRLSDVLSVPVRQKLPPPYQYERLHASFSIDEDLILNVSAFGAATNDVRRLDVHELRFGLRLR